jgi:hypothetical protein
MGDLLPSSSADTNSTSSCSSSGNAPPATSVAASTTGRSDSRDNADATAAATSNGNGATAANGNDAAAAAAEMVAVKVLPPRQCKAAEFVRELEMMAHCRHQYLVALKVRCSARHVVVHAMHRQCIVSDSDVNISNAWLYIYMVHRFMLVSQHPVQLGFLLTVAVPCMWQSWHVVMLCSFRKASCAASWCSLHAVCACLLLCAAAGLLPGQASAGECAMLSCGCCVMPCQPTCTQDALQMLQTPGLLNFCFHGS